MPGTMLGTGDTGMDMTDTGLALTELTSRLEVGEEVKTD